MSRENESKHQAEKPEEWQARDDLRRIVYRIVYPECFNEEDIETLLKSASGEKPLTLEERTPYSVKFDSSGLTEEITGERIENLLNLLTKEERIMVVLSTGMVQHRMFSCDQLTITFGIPPQEVDRHIQGSLKKIKGQQPRQE